MNKYETIIIFNSEENAETIYGEEVRKYLDIFQKWTPRGKRVKVEKMGEKKLAYDIKGFTTGWYAIFRYECEPEYIAEAERLMRIDDHVIKFITLKVDDEDDELDECAEVEEVKSEQQPDAYDVLLGFAEYAKKGVD